MGCVVLCCVVFNSVCFEEKATIELRGWDYHQSHATLWGSNRDLQNPFPPISSIDIRTHLPRTKNFIRPTETIWNYWKNIDNTLPIFIGSVLNFDSIVIDVWIELWLFILRLLFVIIILRGLCFIFVCVGWGTGVVSCIFITSPTPRTVVIRTRCWVWCTALCIRLRTRIPLLWLIATSLPLIIHFFQERTEWPARKVTRT